MSTVRRPIKTESFTDLHLAPRDADGGNRSTYRVSTVEEGQSELLVTVAPHAPDGGLWLWGTARPPGELERNLLEAWQRLDDPGLATRIVTGRLDPVPTGAAGDVAGLSRAQISAYLACTTPGVRVIWGPPGTGKTTVLARAIDDLVTRGRRVLLVSSTNIAVDNALAAVIRLRQPPPGELVRVGPPTMAEIARDDRVVLPRLAEAAVAKLTAEQVQVGQEIKELAARPEIAHLRELDQRLAGFDPDRYRAAAARHERDRRLAELTDRLAVAEDQVQAAGRTREDWRRAHQVAVERHVAAEPARAQLRAAANLRAEAERLETIATSAEADVLTVEARIREARWRQESLSGGSPAARLRSRPERSRLAAEISAFERDLAVVGRSWEDARRLADRFRNLNAPRIAEHERAAAPVTEVDLAWLDQAVAGAQSGAATADRALRDAERERADIRSQREETLAQPGADAIESAYLAAADRAGLPRLAAERAELAAAMRTILAHRQALEERYEQLLTAIARAQNDTEPTLIGQARLVATTLSRFRLNRHVYRGGYDAVFIDEAGAAALPELLLAAAKGRQTVVLLGDFRQLGPVQPDDVAQPNDATRKWLDERSCFDLLDLRDPEDALTRPGVVTLRETRRFGADVVELANRIAYGGVLIPSATQGRPAVDDGGDAQIVLVDVDGLGDVSRARVPDSGSGRWWIIGSLLSRAIAEHHRERGESTGIVTPYRAERFAIIDHLDDVGSLGGIPAIEAGTVHSFQGREFDVIIVDTVEDGEWAGWCASAAIESSRPREYSGARLVNVAVTRARQRVYLLVSGRAIRSAAPRTTFGHIRALVDQRTIRLVRAAQLLGLPADELDQARPDPLVSEIWAAFAGHVVAEAVFDEFGYITAVVEAISRAQHSVWIWSPWFGARLDEVLPALALVKDRGVTTRVFIVDDSDSVIRGQRAQGVDVDGRLTSLRAVTSQVVRIRQMHQKIVIIDDETIFLGSYNTLSSRGRREIMVRHRGRRFIQKILEHERAAILAQPPTCAEHRRPMEARRSSSRRRGYPWYWACARADCKLRSEIGNAAIPRR
ncbi:AAA domain-containing protein [Pseudofrankia sp. DC12]|uniref:AAA domain-containing protein n=1 Tax=Pseudofrankia sp. DC12 TaxID=683315 RepID=UPI0018DDDFFF|nr:AAA domain-containing protein [Pseudofrankia sp. DC12]